MSTAPEPGAPRPTTHRPKTQRYAMLSVLWAFPSLGALLILGLGWKDWRAAGSVGELLAAVRFEHWIALLLLGLHPVFIGLARHHRRAEVPVPLPPEEESDDEGADPGSPPGGR